jgi:hypothetical protein
MNLLRIGESLKYSHTTPEKKNEEKWWKGVM